MTKKYKCRVEYLESTGTQWIDTGIAPSNITPIVKLKFIPTQQYSSGSYGIFGCFGANNTRFQIFYNSIGIGTYVSKAWQANTTYEVELNGKIPSATINGNVETSGYSTANGFSSDNMYLFTRNNGNVADNGVPLKLYYCKIWNNEILVRDLIPVLDNSGRPAMYDQVSGQLFYNQGSGEFTYGRQIIPVEYLESTGTQYIDTGVKGKNNIDFDYRCIFTNLDGTAQCVGGNWSGASSSSVSLYLGLVRTNGNFAYHYDGTSSPVVVMNTTVQDTPYSVQGHMWTGEQYMVINGTKSSVGTISSTFTSSLNMYLFGINNNGVSNQAYMKLYYCKIYDNGILVRDFIPCIDENLTPFMFDKVNCTVYLNAGTGQFKVGPNVEKAWGGKKLRRKLALMMANLKKPRKYYCEVEYIENTGTGSYRNWINTGIVPDTTTRWEVRLSFNNTTTGKLMGCGYVNPNRFNLGLESNKFRFAFNAWFDANSNITTPDTNAHTWIMDAPSKTFTIDEYSTTTTLTFGKSTFPICLFGRGNSASGNTETTNTVIGKIYYTKIWQNGVLVRDMIPVLDWDMTPCMFDRVTEQFFYNMNSSGTGFGVGRQIHQVDYLESTGTQWIDTGLLSTASSTVDTEFSFTSMESGAANNVGVFGGRNSTTSSTFTFFKIASATPQYFRFDYNGQPQVATASDMTWNTSSKYRFQYNGTNCITTNTTTGESTVLTRSPGSTFTQYQIYLFAVNTAGTIGQYLSGRIYYYKYSDGTNSVDMVPAIDENGVGFMLDRVSHTIYDNAGTGAFGYSAREVEYLQSDGARAIVAGVTVDDTCGYDIKWMALNADDRIIMGTKGAGDSRWVLSGSNNPNVNLSWNTSYGSAGLGLNKIQTARMNYLNDRKRILNDTPLADITQTLSAYASTYSVGIFGGYWGASSISLYSTCRIYYAKITKGTELIRDFIPMVKDGSPCLFDKIGGLYYFGTGTGSFTTGKIVEPEYE